MNEKVQNTFEELLLTQSGKVPMPHKKKCAIWLSVIAIILITNIIGITILSHKRTKEDNQIIEKLTKISLVHSQSIGLLYQNAYEVVQSRIVNGQIAASYNKGDGYDPLAFEQDIEDQKKALNHLCRGLRGDLSEEKIREANDTLGLQWYSYLPDFIYRLNNTRIILSKRESIYTDNDVKMWVYTEMNSGVEFYAAKYKEGDVIVQPTEDGSDRLYNLYIEYYYNAYEKGCSRLREIIRERERQKEYENDALGAMIGASILGGLF